MKLLLISLDAVSDNEFQRLSKYPNTKAFLQKAVAVRGVDSIFLTNTYPIHTSVATGVYPKTHGIISNYYMTPSRPKEWINKSVCIKAKTIWKASKEKGLKVASVFYPVTVGSKDIRYHMPEIAAHPGENQVLVSLKAGSKWFQLKELLRHRKRLRGTEQPYLDDFSTHVMMDYITDYDPDLMLLHLAAYDTICHEHCDDAAALTSALESLDDNLGLLLPLIKEDTAVILFSDHGQLPVEKCLNPNVLLEQRGLLEITESGAAYEEKCYIEACGGSAFFYNYVLSPDEVEEIKSAVAAGEDFLRFITPEELDLCGRGSLLFGYCAKPGYCYDSGVDVYKGNHGYPLDYEGYKVFYATSGPGIRKSIQLSGGSLLDVTALIASLLELDMPSIEGSVKQGILVE